MLAALGALALSGCGSAALDQRRAALSALIGRPEAEAVRALGVPETSYPLGDAKVLVRGQSETWRVPGAPGIPGWATFRCTTSVVVRRGLVSSFDLRGNGCAG
jgi:hypothetical protein